MKRLVVALAGIALLIAAAPLVSLAFFADGPASAGSGPHYSLRFEQAPAEHGDALEMGYSEADLCATEHPTGFIG